MVFEPLRTSRVRFEHCNGPFMLMARTFLLHRELRVAFYKRCLIIHGFNGSNYTIVVFRVPFIGAKCFHAAMVILFDDSMGDL